MTYCRKSNSVFSCCLTSSLVCGVIVISSMMVLVFSLCWTESRCVSRRGPNTVPGVDRVQVWSGGGVGEVRDCIDCWAEIYKYHSDRGVVIFKVYEDWVEASGDGFYRGANGSKSKPIMVSSGLDVRSAVLEKQSLQEHLYCLSRTLKEAQQQVFSPSGTVTSSVMQVLLLL